MSLRLENVNYIYSQNTVYETTALKNINLTIGEHEWIGIIGHTGSGKSTLTQHMNGLMKATSGRIYFHDKNIYEKGFEMRSFRCKVGLVFQYPEHQLFASDVLEDVCFGPKNQGCSKEEAQNRAVKALQQVGIGEETYKKSPFELSGGQQRRVAIAGVLAMEPEILILDEPTAGLDPMGRKRILDLLKKMYEERNISVVLVSHSMEDIAEYVHRLIVMDKGQILYDDMPKNIFAHQKELEEIGLTVPQTAKLMSRLKEEGFEVDDQVITVKEAVQEIKKAMKNENRTGRNRMEKEK